MKQKICLLICLVFVFSAIGLFAEEDPFADGGEAAFFAVEEEIASVASKYAQKVEETPAIISVVTNQQIKNVQARNLLDIIRNIPGVEVFRTQDGYYRVAFRGVRGTANVLFMLDGHRVNSFYDGASLYNISSDVIERVELIRGPGSNMHGTNAFVGVINVITKNWKDHDKAKGEAVISGASFGKKSGMVKANVTLGDDWKTSLLFHKIDRDGSPDLTVNEIDQGRPNTNRPESVNDDLQQTYYILNATNEKSDISAKIITENRGAYIGFDGRLNDNQYIKRNISTIDYTTSTDLTENSSLNFKFYWDSQENESKRYHKYLPAPASAELYSITQYKSETLGSELMWNWKLSEKMLWVCGIQYENMQLHDYKFLTNFLKTESDPGYFKGYGFKNVYSSFGNYHNLSFPQNTDRRIIGYFAQHEWKIRPLLGTTIGARYDDYSDFGTTFNPKIAAVSNPFKDEWLKSDVEVLKNLVIKMAYSTAFRAPTFQELYDRSQIDNFNGSNGNVNLDPETIETIEIGIQTKWKLLDWRINFFDNTIEDNIMAMNVNHSAGPGEAADAYNNINGIDIKGFETELKITKDKINYAFANISSFKAEQNGGYLVDKNNRSTYSTNLTSVPQYRMNIGLNFDGSLIPYVKDQDYARHYSMFLNYQFISERNNDVWDAAGVEGGYVSKYFNNLANQWRIGDKHIFNLVLKTTESKNKNVQFSFAVYNLLDEKLYDDYYDVGAINTDPAKGNTDATVYRVNPREFVIKVTSKF